MTATVFGVGVSYGAVSRTDGASALQRSRYQTRTSVAASNGRTTLHRGSGHTRTWLLLPHEAPEWAHDREQLWIQAGLVENRYDAREGRFFDITWPRALPLELVDEAVEKIYARFKEDGLAVQIDFHVVAASDGLANPHLHGLISTRALSREGLSKRKDRNLDVWFRSNRGRTPRQHVAAIFNELSQLHNLDVEFDPGTNAERGLPEPEDRIPASYLKSGGRVAQEMLARRSAQRAAREEWLNTQNEAERISADLEKLEHEIIREISLLPRFVPPTGVTTTPLPRGIWNAIASELPFTSNLIDVGRPEWLAVGVGSSVVIDIGDAICLDGEIDTDMALVLDAMVSAKGWPDALLLSDDANRLKGSWFRRKERIEPHGGSIPRGLALNGILELQSAARKDGASKATIEKLRALLLAENRKSSERLVRRLSIMRFDFVPPPTYEDFHRLIDDAARGPDDRPAPWEAYRISLDFSCFALASHPWGLAQRRPRPRTQSEPGQKPENRAAF